MRAYFNLSDLPKTVFRNGEKYFVSLPFNGGNNSDLRAFIFSNNPELDGSYSDRPNGYTYSWVSATIRGNKVAFNDVPDFFVDKKTLSRTEKHVKRLMRIFNTTIAVSEMPTYRSDLRYVDDDTVVFCEISRCNIRRFYAIEIIGGFVHKMHEDKLMKCSRTSKYFWPKPNGANWIQTEGGIVHISYRSLHKKCRKCGIYHNASLNFCSECAQNHWLCGDCGDVFHDDDVQHDVNDKLICDNCRAYYGNEQCECCGYYYNLPDGYTACEDCSGSAIYNYGHKHSCNLSYENMMFGVEMEVCVERADNDSQPCREQVAYMLKKQINEVAVIKSDSSIDYGFEIVTKPLDYCDAISHCRRILSLADSMRCRADSSCGIHIHVSREHISRKAIANLIFMLSEMEGDITKVAGRYSDEWARISKKSKDDCECVDDVIQNEYDCGRYRAINLINDATIEFRVFASTTSMNTITAYIQFVKCIIDYAETHTLDDIEGSRLRYIMIGKESLYPELMQYLRQVNVL